MAFNINQFRSSFSNTGEVLSPAHFEVQVLPPAGLASNGIELQNLSFRCEGASIPAKSIEQLERRTYGPRRKIAYRAVYDDITLTFIASANMKERKFFSDWMNLIQNSGEILNSNFNVKYYDSYISNLILKMYDKCSYEVYRVNLFEAYPVNISPIELSWDARNQYVRFSVTFSYRYWEDSIGSPKSNSVFELISNGLRISQIIKDIKTARTDPVGAVVRIVQANPEIFGEIGTISTAPQSPPGNVASQQLQSIFNSIF